MLFRPVSAPVCSAKRSSGGTNTDQRRFRDEPSGEMGIGISVLVGNVFIFIMVSYNVHFGVKLTDGYKPLIMHAQNIIDYRYTHYDDMCIYYRLPVNGFSQ